MRSSSILKRSGFSVPRIVLMMYLLSLEKKKNDPLLPAPCPDLKILWTFEAISNDFYTSKGVNLSRSIICLNFSAWWLYIVADILIPSENPFDGNKGLLPSYRLSLPIVCLLLVLTKLSNEISVWRYCPPWLPSVART